MIKFKGLKRNVVGLVMVGVLSLSGAFSKNAQAVSVTWDTFYISSSNKQMSVVCSFPCYVGTYSATMKSASGTGVGKSNLIQAGTGTTLDKASYVVTLSNSPVSIVVKSSGSVKTYINSILSFNVGTGTAHTTGTLSHT